MQCRLSRILTSREPQSAPRVSHRNRGRNRIRRKIHGQRKQGTSNDLAVLYLALSKAAGLDSDAESRWPIAVRGTFDSKFLSARQLTSLWQSFASMARISISIPGPNFARLPSYDWKHSLAGGIDGECRSASSFTPPNNSNGAITARVADLIVDSQGGVTGTIKILMNGPEALRWRRLNLVTDSDRT